MTKKLFFFSIAILYIRKNKKKGNTLLCLPKKGFINPAVLRKCHCGLRTLQTIRRYGWKNQSSA